MSLHSQSPGKTPNSIPDVFVIRDGNLKPWRCLCSRPSIIATDIRRTVSGDGASGSGDVAAGNIAVGVSTAVSNGAAVPVAGTTAEDANAVKAALQEAGFDSAVADATLAKLQAIGQCSIPKLHRWYQQSAELGMEMMKSMLQDVIPNPFLFAFFYAMLKKLDGGKGAASKGDVDTLHCTILYLPQPLQRTT